MSVEITLEEQIELLREETEDRRHQELLSVLQAIKERVAKDPLLFQLAGQANSAVDRLTSAIEELRNTKQDINIDNHQAEIIESIRSISLDVINNQEKLIQEISRLKEWELSFTRNNLGYIESPVIFKQIK